MKFLKATSDNIKLIDQCINLSFMCNQQDNLSNPIFYHEDFLTIVDSNCIYYTLSDSKLVGFMGVSLISDYSIELCGFVHPEYRNQQIASYLLEMIFDDYDDYMIYAYIDSNNINGKAFLESYNAKYNCCECALQLEKKNYVPSADIIDLTLEESLDTLKYTALIQNNPIGTVMVSTHGDVFTIHHVEIYENFRGKKLSYKLLCSVLNQQFETHSKSILHVTKENTAAYKLYTNLGFTPYQQLYYYSI